MKLNFVKKKSYFYISNNFLEIFSTCSLLFCTLVHVTSLKFHAKNMENKTFENPLGCKSISFDKLREMLRVSFMLAGLKLKD